MIFNLVGIGWAKVNNLQNATLQVKWTMLSKQLSKIMRTVNIKQTIAVPERTLRNHPSVFSSHLEHMQLFETSCASGAFWEL